VGPNTCCGPACGGKLCGAGDGCGGTCTVGSGCCAPTCGGKACGLGDGCGGACAVGSGCNVSYTLIADFGDARLTGLCPGLMQRDTMQCEVGASHFCRDPSIGGYVSGFILSNSATQLQIQCVSLPMALPTFTLGQVQGFQPSCGSATYYSVACQAACDALCVQSGYAGGYGPTDVGAGLVGCACFPNVGGFVTRVTIGHTPNCAAQNFHSSPCDTEVAQQCQAMGFAGGHGPVEVSPTLMDILCVH
jgi:hypothetical protein